jgi:Leucine-rich repeat (LRR) protein
VRRWVTLRARWMPFTQLSVCSNTLGSLQGLGGAVAGDDVTGGCAELESLAASNNQLAALGDALAGCTALQHLDVTANRLTSLRGLRRCRLLSTLAASDNSLSVLEGPR